MKHAKRFLQEETAVTSIEYALIASLIAAVIVTAVATLGTTLFDLYKSITTAFTSP